MKEQQVTAEKTASNASAGMARSAGRFGAATMLSRVLGLVREQMFAALLGAGHYADAFVVAFRIPNLLRDLFAEGALSAAFVPTFTDYLKNRGRREAFALANRVMNTLALVLGTLVVAGAIFSEELVRVLAANFQPDTAALAARLTRIMLPFLPIVSLAAVAMGMLTSQLRFGAPALAPAMFNVVSITVGAALYLSGVGPEMAVTGWAVGTLLGGLGQLLIQLVPLQRTGWRPGVGLDLRLRDPGVQRIAKLMGPATVGLAATQLNIVVNTFFASSIEGAPAWLAYAFRLMQLPIGVFGVAVATVATAGIARRAAERDIPGVSATLGSGLRLVAFLTVPSTAALAVLAEPVIRLIFERGRFLASDTSATAAALVGYSLGLYAYAAVKVLAPAFYALDRARIPMKASMTAVAANVVLNVALFPIFGFEGLAIGTSAAALTNFGVLYLSWKRAGGSLAGERLWGHLGKVAVASALAALAGWAFAAGIDRTLGHAALIARLIQTLGALTVGGLVYLAACRALRVAELEIFTGLVRRRLRR